MQAFSGIINTELELFNNLSFIISFYYSISRFGVNLYMQIGVNLHI